MRPYLTLRSFWLGLMLLVASTAAVVAVEGGASFQEVEESLTCQCGCGLTVHSCNHVSCDSALPLRAEIRGMLDKGMGKEETLAAFAAKYGEKILSAPTATGFNLLAWITPFVVVGVAILLVLLIVRRWGAERPPLAAASAAPRPSAPQRSPEEEILERELESFDA